MLNNNVAVFLGCNTRGFLFSFFGFLFVFVFFFLFGWFVVYLFFVVVVLLFRAAPVAYGRSRAGVESEL